MTQEREEEGRRICGPPRWNKQSGSLRPPRSVDARAIAQVDLRAVYALIMAMEQELRLLLAEVQESRSRRHAQDDGDDGQSTCVGDAWSSSEAEEDEPDRALDDEGWYQ